MIITDEKMLRVKCEDALPDEIGPIVDQLERELKRSADLGRGGIGLASIQIGIPKNIAIIRINERYSVNLVNAEIINKYEPEVFEGEGCLSFPDKFVKSLRYKEIHVVNNMGDVKKFIAQGLVAVVIQHELDHLNGRILPDIAIKEDVPVKVKVRPNDPCSCNSGKKAKRCCYK